jgi:predicted nucleic acid-binding protein
LPLFFLDTSALAKYYRRESGSDVVEQLFADSGAQRVISRLALVEMESVFALKIRTGEIDQQAALTARQRLESDLGRRHILMAAVRDEHFQVAKLFVIKYGRDHGLRTLDALQLSVASGLQRAGFAPLFVAADQRLCRTAELEGFRVINPEQPMPILI